MKDKEKEEVLKLLYTLLSSAPVCEVKTSFRYDNGMVRSVTDYQTLTAELLVDLEEWYASGELDSVKVFLRPYSSMTPEEKESYRKLSDVGASKCVPPRFARIVTNWFDQRHIDYGDWIDLGYAIPVTEECNPYKKKSEP
jgi:hypothetical protein